MRRILLLLVALLFAGLASFAQSDSINWKNPYHGSVNTIIETQYRLTENTKVDSKEFSESDFLAFEQKLSLVDSSILQFNEDEMIFADQTFCANPEEDFKIVLCFSTILEHGNKDKWLTSEVYNLIEKDTLYYKALTYTKEGLPVKGEGRNSAGKLTEYNYYEFNDKGFITKVTVEDLEVKDKIEVTKTYKKDGYLLSSYSIKYFANEIGRLSLGYQSEMKYEYLEFDKNGNWTKRRAIDEDGRVSYAYRTYIYNQ